MKMDQTKLDRILELHKLWLSGKPEGERADLSKANLSEAKYAYCRGNNTTIKTIHCDTYDIAYTDAVLQIGCEQHEIAEWWKFSDAKIRAMDGSEALDWWKIWKASDGTLDNTGDDLRGAWRAGVEGADMSKEGWVR